MTHRINSPWFWAMLIAAELLLGCVQPTQPRSIPRRATAPAVRADAAAARRPGVGGWPLGMEWQSLYWAEGSWLVERRKHHWIPAQWEQTGSKWHFLPGHWDHQE